MIILVIKMIRRVFSSFDPTIRLFSVSWLVIFYFVFFLPIIYWAGGSMKSIFLGAFNFIFSEALSLVSNKKGLGYFIVRVICMVSLLNFLALFPFCFSVTSHLLVTFPLAYSFWLGIIFFGLYSSFRGFLSHLVPSGTPIGLISFIVIIEFLRNLIRPLALMFRLTANIIAGHLLLSLVGGFLVTLPFRVLLGGSLLQGFLVIIELGVSFIQAYVFSTLLMLYISERDH